MNHLTRLVALCFVATTVCAADDLPRYQLPVGRVLHYSAQGSSKENNGAPGSRSRSTWQLTVVDNNSDGSARVIARSGMTYTPAGANADMPERVSTAAFDLYPDGRYRIDPQQAIRLSPQSIFPRLPGDANQAKTQWQDDVDWTGSRTTYAPQAADKPTAEFAFTAVQDGPTNRIYITTHKSTFHFDRARGVVTKVDGEFSQDWGFHQKGTSEMKLDKEETIPADQAADLARDYATFRDAATRYNKTMEGLHDEPARGQEIIDAAKAILTSAADKVQHQDVKREFADKLQQHDQYAKYSLEEAKRFADVLNKPAADWSAKDLDGKPLAARDLRGKVVV
ncbi:MAG TPA: hypothetical protein VH475_19625, partial [Tepidisphaeraceae bacterium]